MAFDFNGKRKPAGREGGSGFYEDPDITDEWDQSDPFADPDGEGDLDFSPFQDRPQRRATPRPPATRPSARRSWSPPDFFQAGLPWEKILPIAGLVLAVLALWLFRDAITALLGQILAWTIVILIIVLIFKWILGSGRR